MLKGGGSYAMPWHWHDCLMLILPSVGALDLRHEDQRDGVWVSEDRFALVPAHRAHETCAWREPHAHVALYVTDTALARMESQLGSLAGVRRLAHATGLFPVTPEIRALQALCQDESPNPLGVETMRHHLSAALLIGCLAVVERGEMLPPASHRAHGGSLVAELKAYIATRIGQDLALDELAGRFSVSRRHLTRLFRDRTGQSIGEFQAATRLAAARRLLVETDLPVSEIAYRVGFESCSALSRAMRRQEGSSPTRLRRAGMARSVNS
ncbi:AraC family transcriptional regulator [Xanthobacter sp. KR7-225]|uniref:AraC family transcriptional regulator n=1 Tax=Xanthobacter sp. KR7-225 TaxID=3156613 RepID=UPI0032B5912B